VSPIAGNGSVIDRHLCHAGKMSPGQPWDPRTIIRCRYGGAYEGGPWAAFPCHPEEIPGEAHGGDQVCITWWALPTMAAGVGMTPDHALADLERIVDACEHPQQHQREVPVGFDCRYCGQTVRIDHP
jgi:hypothetical protein